LRIPSLQRILLLAKAMKRNRRKLLATGTRVSAGAPVAVAVRPRSCDSVLSPRPSSAPAEDRPMPGAQGRREVTRQVVQFPGANPRHDAARAQGSGRGYSRAEGIAQGRASGLGGLIAGCTFGLAADAERRKFLRPGAVNPGFAEAQKPRPLPPPIWLAACAHPKAS
jgi:hypothetical protein